MIGIHLLIQSVFDTKYIFDMGLPRKGEIRGELTIVNLLYQRKTYPTSQYDDRI